MQELAKTESAYPTHQPNITNLPNRPQAKRQA